MENQQPERWSEMKGDLVKNWNKISPEEWEGTRGDKKSITSKLQEKYGMGQDDATHKVSAFFEKFHQGGSQMCATGSKTGDTNQNSKSDNNEVRPLDPPRASQSLGGHQKPTANSNSNQRSGQNPVAGAGKGSGAGPGPVAGSGSVTGTGGSTDRAGNTNASSGKQQRPPQASHDKQTVENQRPNQRPTEHQKQTNSGKK